MYLNSETHSSPTHVAEQQDGGSFLFGLLIAMFVVVMSLAGCASMGRDFPSGMVSEIRIGETTQAEVREMFGKPWRVGIDSGTRVWTYGRYRYSLFEAVAPSETEDLVIRFDHRGVVQAYNYNTTRHQQ